jgi:bifunctional UDP-N-acetylglucosamine pyrophosphorylase/glucosamine-1-phosphate N-acetyltransferase
VPVSVIVLAAGQGKRMNSAVPKVLQPLAGRPLLAHVLDAARVLTPASIHIVYGHGAELVRAAFPGADLIWNLQSEQLGTGHAVATALPEIPDDHQVLVLSGDVPLVEPKTLQRLIAGSSDGQVALLTAEFEQPSGYGRVLRNELGEVVRIVEHKDASDDERRVNEINTGLLALTAGPLKRWLGRLTNDNTQGEYYLTDVIGLAFADGVKVEGVLVDESTEVLGINDRAQLALAERSLQRRHAAALMLRGATLADPERFDVRGELEVGSDVFIDVGAVFEGRVTLGNRVHIGPYAVIADTELGEGCVVHAHTVMQGVIAGPECEIGPFARIRPGTALASNVKIGNFVEVKNSEVAEGSKINHLSYIGDASIGCDVNVGAGTITCNYDGANKHRTVIGDRVFIGSGAMLVAPLEVGADATIGAGSTITKHAPAGQLTVARTRQTSIDGWVKPRKRPADAATQEPAPESPTRASADGKRAK